MEGGHYETVTAGEAVLRGGAYFSPATGEIHEVIERGDHHIFVGEVNEAVQHGEAEVLTLKEIGANYGG